MTHRHPLRLAAVAAVTALSGFGAHAVEATQWEPQAAATPAAAPIVNTDATREPLAWTVSRHEATEFHDAVSLGSMASRAEVRGQLAAARAHGLMADTGEAGATDSVLERRALFAAVAQHPVLAAAPATPTATADPIAEIAATSAPMPGAETAGSAALPRAAAGGSMYSLAPDGMPLDAAGAQAPGEADATSARAPAEESAAVLR